ncbi:MAG: hypothetical protein U0175_05520 [Caldilineaceae bacterium]
MHAHLPVEYAVALYWQRWRIEDAYAIVKRLLGFSFLSLFGSECCTNATLGDLDSLCGSG